MDGNSFNIAADQIDKLKSLFPEVVDEGKIDWEKLRLTLGDDVAIADERYVLNWAGKSDAFRAIQTPTTATLKPQKDQSINFESSDNIFIEGENLEVLKVLQKSYYNKIKMIYIDPPYNTGNDHFVYPDKFSESKDEYLRRIGDKDEEGYLTREGLFRRNSKENGQFHSNWLSMMYPRLFLARNLLRDDRVIFISIDDNEVHNLRLLMNEIFGEENFVASIIWQKKQSPQNDATYFSDMHDYILVYAKRAKLTKDDSGGWQRSLLERNDEQISRYKNPDMDKRGVWASVDLTSNKSAEQRPRLYYPIHNPKTGKEIWPPKQRVWRFEKNTMRKLIDENKLWWGDDKDNFPRLKRFLSEVQKGVVPSTWWTREFAGDNQESRREIRSIFWEGNVDFDTPKPTKLVKKFIEIASSGENGEEEIILDFFAGSGTTGQAVLEVNNETNGNITFVLVQIPEIISEDSETFKAGYKTISDICKERIRRVSKNMSEPPLAADVTDSADVEKQFAMELNDHHPKYSKGNGKQTVLNNGSQGFKVFTLQPSNFKIWRTDVIESEEDLRNQMDAFADPVKTSSEEENMAWEILLKSGFDLTTKMERLSLGGANVFTVADGKLMLVLDLSLGTIKETTVREIIKAKPEKVLMLDKLFAGNDQLKTNTVLQMKDAGVGFETI